MYIVYIKEIRSFFSSLIGYMALGVFFLMLGLMTWVFPDYSILEYGYASLDSFFELAPFVFLFLIPAVTMRAFAEEWQTGTYELLVTKPVSLAQIVGGKFLASWTLVILALLPTVLYWYTVHILGSPVGNVDFGATLGSYLGLFLLGGVFVAIGLFSSALTANQIVAFLLGALLCFLLFWGFLYISKVPLFVGRVDDLIQQLGINYHYLSISRGVVDSRDVIYYLSIIIAFLMLTGYVIQRKKG
ncbi:MAG: gliding motility-associated ABC transporter permease subunit GldF [Saprospiraceae bacterium]|nr:gliding motility-associated ABC transporter permease subunit GldF [Saprospiraceae bacterium]